MVAVGVRELKNRLSEYVRLVRAGEHVLVTDHGTVVAELRRPGTAALGGEPSGLRDLLIRGEAQADLPDRADLYPPLAPILDPGEASRLLDEERGG